MYRCSSARRRRCKRYNRRFGPTPPAPLFQKIRFAIFRSSCQERGLYVPWLAQSCCKFYGVISVDYSFLLQYNTEYQVKKGSHEPQEPHETQQDRRRTSVIC